MLEFCGCWSVNSNDFMPEISITYWFIGLIVDFDNLLDLRWDINMASQIYFSRKGNYFIRMSYVLIMCWQELGPTMPQRLAKNSVSHCRPVSSTAKGSSLTATAIPRLEPGSWIVTSKSAYCGGWYHCRLANGVAARCHKRRRQS